MKLLKLLLIPGSFLRKIWVLVLLIAIFVNIGMLYCLAFNRQAPINVTFGNSFRVSPEKDFVLDLAKWVTSSSSLSTREKILFNTLLLERVNNIMVEIDSNQSCERQGRCIVSDEYIKEIKEYYTSISSAANCVQRASVVKNNILLGSNYDNIPEVIQIFNNLKM